MKINLFMNFNGKLFLFRDNKKKDDNYIESILIESQANINNILEQKYKLKSKEIII